LGWIRIRIRGSMPLTNGSGLGSGSWIRILLFSSLTFRCQQKTNFVNTIFSAYDFSKLHLHHLHHLHQRLKFKKSHKIGGIKKLLFLHDDRRIRILEAQKHVDPVDPDSDSDPDPQHCFQHHPYCEKPTTFLRTFTVEAEPSFFAFLFLQLTL
jgi:hypothetical protein